MLSSYLKCFPKNHYCQYLSPKNTETSTETSTNPICLVDYAILVNWLSPFPILGVSGGPFHFYSALIEIPVSKNSVDPDQICTVCLCPNNVTLGIRGLIDGMATTDCAFNQFNYTKGNNLCYHHDILSVEVFSQKSLRSKPD